MHKFFSAIFVLLLCISTVIPCTLKAQENSSINSVLDTAERFFISLKTKEYKPAWNLLSKKSQETIIKDIYKASNEIGANTTIEDIQQDFDNSGLISKNYWDAFLDTFDPNLILENSRWEIGFIKENKAEIIIKQKKSEEPARLKLFKENNKWKVGLVETFWTRKL
jgi:hypothetical protein